MRPIYRLLTTRYPAFDASVSVPAPTARDIFHSFARRVMYVPFPSGANAYPSRR